MNPLAAEPSRADAYPHLSATAVEAAVERLTARHGAPHREAIARGVRQVAERWWKEDGDEAAFAVFCDERYLPDPADRDQVFARLAEALEQVDGHLHELHRELRRPLDTDTGPLGSADLLLGDVDLHANVDPDLYRTGVAFLALLHFPVHTLEERRRASPGWDRAAWARSCFMDRFAVRVPPHLVKEATRALNAADLYISEYDIRMDRVLTPDGRRPFREGLRLIAHWGLRDELKATYAAGAEGIERQRIVQRIMERIVRQEIPERVRGNAELLWCPETNEVRGADGAPADRALAAREPDTRYARLLDVFHALRAMDPYAPTAPTFIRRRFEMDRQMHEPEVASLLVSVLDAPELGRLAARIAERLERPLEPFDIWYTGYQPMGDVRGDVLDAAAAARFPNAAAFEAKIPETLERLGFAPERARWLAERIVVDPARGSGHALGAARRGDRSHLRTRVPAGGMNYQGFNVAMHELGHNVEQVFSLDGIDHWALNGVPNTAFTEAFAFTFQERDLEVLGVGEENGAAEERAARQALHSLWKTAEIAGVSLVDMKIWEWLYAHPDASPAAARAAVLQSAREVWNRWFRPHLGTPDCEILAVYSHIVNSALYLPDYAIGEIVMFQLWRSLRTRPFGAEVERLTRLGRLTPDAWMREAVGEPVSTEPLLTAAREALDAGA